MINRYRVPLVLLFFASSAGAREWDVFPDSTGDAPFAQAAIDKAEDGDLIHLLAGVHPGDSLIVESKALTICGDGLGATHSPAIIFRGTGIEAVIVRDLALREDAEGMRFDQLASVVMDRCEVAGSSHGVRIRDVADVSVRFCEFRGNERGECCESTPTAGAMSIEEVGRVHIDFTTFADNRGGNTTAGYGAGAIAVASSSGGEVEIYRSVFLRNSAPTGAAIGVQGNVQVDVHRSLFFGNEAPDAVIRTESSGDGRIFANVFAKNRASGIWDDAPDLACGCNVYWLNDSTDPRQYVGDCDQLAEEGWIDAILDPQFCNWRGDDFTVARTSAVLVANLPEEMEGACGAEGNLGGLSNGCERTPVLESTWGALKARFTLEADRLR